MSSETSTSGLLSLPSRIRGWFLNPVLRIRTLIVVSSILALMYVISVILYVRRVPSIGARCAFSCQVNSSDPAHSLSGRDNFLQKNDVIVQLGSKRIYHWPQLAREIVFAGEASPVPMKKVPRAEEFTQHPLINVKGQTYVLVGFDRGKERHWTWCRLTNPPLKSLTATFLWLLTKVGLFMVGALVFWKRPRDASARQFFLLCLISCGAFIGGYQWERIVTDPVLILVFMACSILLPPISLHFYLVFPRPKPFLRRRPTLTLLATYAIPVLFLTCLIMSYFLVRALVHHGDPSSTGGNLQTLLQIHLTTIYVYFGIAFLIWLLSIASMFHSLRTAKERLERQQVKCLLFGALMTLAPMGYTLYLAMMKRDEFGSGGARWYMFSASLIVTLAFTVSMTRYGLMKLEQILSSSAIYFGIVVLAAVFYYVLVIVGFLLLGRHVIDSPSFIQVLGVSGTVLLLILVLDVLRGRLKMLLDRRFQRRKTQLDETLQQMSDAISQLVDGPTLGKRLLQSVTDLLGVERGAVYLHQEDPDLFRLTGARGEPPSLHELPPGSPLLKELQSENPLLMVAENGDSETPGQRQLRFLGGAVGCALTHESEMRAILLLGKKERGTWTNEDRQLLTAFCQMTALALVSGEGGRRIEELNHELQAKIEKIAEQQRQILRLQSLLMRRQDDQSRDVIPPEDAEVADLPKPAERPESTIIGSSPPMLELMALTRKVASSNSAVLLRGESGTGKELLAEALHLNSPRADKPFVKVHCAALAPTLLESELFGHIKGAFTGADNNRVGRFESADGGTLFLDEIGDVSLEVQTKLLRVLQEMSFERVGSSVPIKVDVRIVAATHQNLEKLIREGRFRQDLFYRLNVLPVAVPPLRERREDLPELIQYFLRTYGERCGKHDLEIEDDALLWLRNHDWPGNVRQLENVIERAVIVAEGDRITLADLPSEVVWEDTRENGSSSGNVLQSLDGLREEREEQERQERERYVRALAATKGNKAKAARALGMARSTFVSRLKKFGLS